MRDGQPLSREELANYGEDLLDRYMDILSDPECFVKKSYCLACKSEPCQFDCQLNPLLSFWIHGCTIPYTLNLRTAWLRMDTAPKLTAAAAVAVVRLKSTQVDQRAQMWVSWETWLNLTFTYRISWLRIMIMIQLWFKFIDWFKILAATTTPTAATFFTWLDLT